MRYLLHYFAAVKHIYQSALDRPTQDIYSTFTERNNYDIIFMDQIIEGVSLKC